MKRLFLLSFVFGCVFSFFNGSALADRDATKAERWEKKVEQTIVRFKEKDPSLKEFFDNAYGYAVFPDVGGGAFIAGFIEGEGLVYEKGEIIGKTTMHQVTIGLQAGGKNYSEIIFFRDKEALDSLKSSALKLSEQVSAIVVTAGASKRANYQEGVAVFAIPRGGLMLEGSIGGQQFKFEPYQP